MESAVHPEYINDTSCHLVNNLNKSLRCNFILTTQACQQSDRMINYVEFMYCTFGADGTAKAMCISVVCLLIMFIALGVTAEDFLCSALVVISKTLHLSQNIAGVTFLAFGNGSPDIFSSLAGVQQLRSDLVIGELFGAGIFVTTVVAGSICLSQEFTIMRRPFLRDTGFYLVATFWAFFLYHQEYIKLGHAVGFIVLYGGYIAAVVISRLIFNKQRNKKSSNNVPTVSEGVSRQVSNYLKETTEYRRPVLQRDMSVTSFKGEKNKENICDSCEQGIALRKFHQQNSLNRRPVSEQRMRSQSLIGHHLDHVINYITKDDLDMSLLARIKGEDKRLRSQSDNAEISSRAYNKAQGLKRQPIPLVSQFSNSSSLTVVSVEDSLSSELNFGPWKTFFYHVCPVNILEWNDKSWFFKVFEVIKAPIYFLLTVTIPVVDYENYKHNWCRYLNILHCITGPMFMFLSLGKTTSTIGGVFPVWALVLVVSLVLAVVVFYTSSHEEPPKYHAAFGYLGFAISVTWIFKIASEVVFLLEAIGLVMNLSDTILGLTVLAWGNSLGDFISNMSVARQGFPRMGISACFGGPLLNLVLGFGLSYLIILSRENTVHMKLQLTQHIQLLYATLVASVVSTLVVMSIKEDQESWSNRKLRHGKRCMKQIWLKNIKK
ncbi:mitochondrial sodium/calcium exchanger protein-like isoform X2 [Tachypleus tridentatus]|uniref:mitochondrial sodium/calcium exchanger protein-like isoform X2 n=1 Tax=Tachypleus tridentatus TaxID=6853 RepID=UPI003FD00633